MAKNVPLLSFRNEIVFIRRSHVLGLMLRLRGHIFYVTVFNIVIVLLLQASVCHTGAHTSR